MTRSARTGARARRAGSCRKGYQTRSIATPWPATLRRAAVLVALTALASLGLFSGCSRQPEVEGYSKTPMARQTVALFLKHLQAGDCASAARYYAGPLAPLLTAFPDVPDDDVPALLERFMSKTGGFCREYRIVAASMRNPICYPVEVEFCTGEGEIPIKCEFLVYFDGRIYQLLGLPPTIEELAAGDDPGGDNSARPDPSGNS